MSRDHTGHEYVGHTYMGHDHIDCIGHNYIGHNYSAEETSAFACPKITHASINVHVCAYTHKPQSFLSSYTSIRP